MNRITLFYAAALAALFLAAAPCRAQTAPDAAPGARASPAALLAAADAQLRFADSDFSCDMRLDTEEADGSVSSSTLRVMRRDRERKVAALVLAPESERGEGYLRNDGNLWFFDAETGGYVHSVVSDSVSDSEMESGDIEPDSLVDSYRVEGMTRGKLGANEVLILELGEKSPQAYPRIRVWLRASDSLLLKEEFFGASGRLIRYVLYPAHLRLGGRTVPSSMIYVDALSKGRRTRVTLSSPRFAPIDDSAFTKAFLEKAR
jgi:outer membrane lipoprotein-sorting protein